MSLYVSLTKYPNNPADMYGGHYYVACIMDTETQDTVGTVWRGTSEKKVRGRAEEIALSRGLELVDET